MNILLDTHVLIWTLENNLTLSNIARDTIIDGNNIVFVSSASVWEIAIKKSIGKLDVPDNLIEEIELHRFTPLPISYAHAQLVANLPHLHKDPFDRILIAQALLERLTLITRDELIMEYEVKTIRA